MEKIRKESVVSRRQEQKSATTVEVVKRLNRVRANRVEFSRVKETSHAASNIFPAHSGWFIRVGDALVERTGYESLEARPRE